MREMRPDADREDRWAMSYVKIVRLIARMRRIAVAAVATQVGRDVTTAAV